MWNKTRITNLLDIDYPIIQGPFGGGLSTSTLASIVSNFGGMGSFGAQHLSANGIMEINDEIRSKTRKPYALNLWVSNKDKEADNYSDKEYETLCAVFKPYFDELSIQIPEKPQSFGSQFEEQVQAVIDAKPPVFSFIYGIPSLEILKACRDRGIKTIGTATTVDEALSLEEAGVDAVVVTGFEAGGHRASFLRSAEDSLMGTIVLIPQVTNKIKIPVIAAGGIADGRGVAAAFTLGADAVQIGTAFLACEESNATDEQREKLFSGDSNGTVLTKMFTGRLSRGIRNRITNEIGNSQVDFAPYPIQRTFFNVLREAALKQGKPDLVTSSAGQVLTILKYRKASELLQSILSQVETVYTSRKIK